MIIDVDQALKAQNDIMSLRNDLRGVSWVQEVTLLVFSPIFCILNPHITSFHCLFISFSLKNDLKWLYNSEIMRRIDTPTSHPKEENSPPIQRGI